MAEAAVENVPSQTRFYCHSCTEEINPKPDYTCPRCDNGFIEEITETFSQPESESRTQDVDPAAQFAELWGRAFLDSFQNQVRGHTDSPSNSQEDAESGEESRPHPFPIGIRGNDRMRPFRISVRHGGSSQGIRGPGTQAQPHLHGLLQMFVDRLTADLGQPVNFLPLHGNPADYAWGVGGLDNIITQLLNQLEGSGPAPASKQDIENLPTAKISQKQVDDGKQCSVCMEDFKLGEEAKRLPCDHHYHEDCILPWLNMHGTCPVCRKDLNGIDSSLKDDYPNPTDLLSNDSSETESSSGNRGSSNNDGSPDIDE